MQTRKLRLRRLFVTVWSIPIILVLCLGSPQGFEQRAAAADRKIDQSGSDGKEPEKIPKLEYTVAESRSDGELTPGNSENPGSRSNTAKKAPTTALSVDRIKELLARLPGLNASPQQKFVIPEQSLVRPSLPGTQTLEPFPPKSTAIATAKPAAPVVLPLKVLRVSHSDGSFDTIKQYSMTFSQPMVPIAAIKSFNDATTLPVKMTPQPPGQWRWAGTQTLLFEPEGGRFPKATEYNVSIAAGTKSVTGGSLPAEQRWTFTTSPPEVTQIYPGRVPLELSPIIVAFFNQKIDRQTALKSLSLIAKDKEYSTHLVADEIVMKDDARRQQVALAEPDQWVAFQVDQPLPKDTHFEVTLKAGFRSDEGLLPSVKSIAFDRYTYGPFEIKERPINFSPEMGAYRSILFSNPIDEKKFSPAMVRITPEEPGVDSFCKFDRIGIRGQLKPKKAYSVTFDNNIVDVFGQQLTGSLRESFTTSSFHLKLTLNREVLVTIPATKAPSITVSAQAFPEMRVTLYAVTPRDWIRFVQLGRARIRERWNQTRFPEAGWKIISSKRYDVGEYPIQANIDLKSASHNGYGHVVLDAETLGVSSNDYRHQFAWIQVTDLAIDAMHERDLFAQVTSLHEGKPVADVAVKLAPEERVPFKKNFVTNKDGITRIELPDTKAASGSYLVASKGDDTAILPQSQYEDAFGWHPHKDRTRLQWFSATDKNLYKPGETVHVKGLVRGHTLDKNNEDAIRLFPPSLRKLSYSVLGADNKELSKGDTTVDKFGAFSFETKLPDAVNLGHARIAINAEKGPMVSIDKFEEGSQGHQISIDIQEFRRPEFEINVSSITGNTLMLNETGRVTAKASYFATGALRNSPIDWTIATSQSTFTPPGWSEFRFTAHDKWQLSDYKRAWTPRYSPHKLTHIQGTTDSAGSDTIDLRFTSLPSPTPIACRCQATVQDVNRQSWSAATSLLLHPSALYVGLKSNKHVYHKGDAPKIEVIVADTNGKLKVDQPINVKCFRIKNGTSSQISEKDIASTNKPLPFALNAEEAGSYILLASVKDELGRPNESSLSYQIEEEKAVNLKTEQQKLNLTASSATYKAGEQAEILIEAPFYPAHALVTMRRFGIIGSRSFEITEPTYKLKIPIKEAHYPSLQVEVYLTGTKSQYANGHITLSVPPLSKTLSLTATAKTQELAPGSDTTIEVELKDSSGAPVSHGQVALVVVDEALLALSGYRWPDPVSEFWMAPYSVVRDYFIRSSVLVLRDPPFDPYAHIAAPGALAQQSSLGTYAQIPVSGRADMEEYKTIGLVEPARDMNMFQVEPTVVDERHYSSGRSERARKIDIRTNFSALALFEPCIETDENGKASVKMHMPDSLGRYRVMAIAAKGDDQFGKSESTFTARLPLLVKPSAPRFLQFGDRCELPYVIQNQTNKDMKVEVVARANNAVFAKPSSTEASLPSGAATGGRDGSAGADSNSSTGVLVDIPANDRVEVAFNMSTDKPGTALIQCAAISADGQDAALTTIPVMVPASMESFATYGTIDDGAVLQKLRAPEDVFTEFGDMTVNTSSTAVQSLTDAYLYLKGYGFDCTEQITSRMIADLSLHDVLAAFGKLSANDEKDYRARMTQDLKALFARQNSDGGFGLWGRDEEKDWPYLTVQVARTLRLAEENGFEVNEHGKQKCLAYLRDIQSHVRKIRSEQARDTLEAAALYVRLLHRDSSTVNPARKLVRRFVERSEASITLKPDGFKNIRADLLKNSLPLDCAGWLLSSVRADAESKEEAALLRQYIDSQVNETPSSASVNSEGGGFGEWNYCLFYSPRRSDAIILEALMLDQPDSDLIPKLVRGLLGHRKNGKWEGTQENGYVLQALAKYFAKYENKTPDFATNAWLGESLIASQKFQWRSTDTKIVSIPISFVQASKSDDILIDKIGSGRLYYRLGLNYVPRNLEIKPADFGFEVERTYEPIDSKDDVRKDENGAWHIKAGSTVRSRVRFTSTGPRYHVAMMDPLPAGAEAVNNSLLGNRTIMPLPLDEDAPSYSPSPTFPEGRSRRHRSGPALNDGSSGYRSHDSFIWWRSWYEHENLRDHQAEAFASLLYPGTYDYTYTMRATTPGDYRVPPTKVEEMYAPETFGRASSERVIIE